MYKILGGNQKEYGPVTADQVREWIAQRRANAQTMVQLEGATEWTPLSALPELAAALNAPPTYATTATAAPAADSPVSVVIPYKNPKALIGYYFGIFSLIPCIGLPLGIAAFVLGILGLKAAKAHPNARGKVHAWVGIILGGLCAVGNIVGVVLMASNLPFPNK
ncbi:MAG TPA: GYF domain-containing protein [Candidatus Limnocylindria bacterium]|nr:GYF domain-containing protein [Candidatus Limnocylindria bacterium]